MGTIKIEFDVPDFEKELKIEVTIKKDGEVIANIPPSNSNKKVEEQPKKKDDKEKDPSIGNMMNINI